MPNEPNKITKSDLLKINRITKTFYENARNAVEAKKCEFADYLEKLIPQMKEQSVIEFLLSGVDKKISEYFADLGHLSDDAEELQTELDYPAEFINRIYHEINSENPKELINRIFHQINNE